MLLVETIKPILEETNAGRVSHREFKIQNGKSVSNPEGFTDSDEDVVDLRETALDTQFLAMLDKTKAPNNTALAIMEHAAVLRIDDSDSEQSRGPARGHQWELADPTNRKHRITFGKGPRAALKTFLLVNSAIMPGTAGPINFADRLPKELEGLTRWHCPSHGRPQWKNLPSQ